VKCTEYIWQERSASARSYVALIEDNEGKSVEIVGVWTRANGGQYVPHLAESDRVESMEQQGLEMGLKGQAWSKQKEYHSWWFNQGDAPW